MEQIITIWSSYGPTAWDKKIVEVNRLLQHGWTVKFFSEESDGDQVIAVFVLRKE